MTSNKSCCFLFCDYIDFDVFLNARIFYRMAGFNLVSIQRFRECELLVFFRGIPDSIYHDYKGVVHFYDYVCEHHIDVRRFFPMACEIIIISIHSDGSYGSDCHQIYGYLPVIPSLWQFSIPFRARSDVPLHISNHKPISNDIYQEQLVFLIKHERIRVFGSRWDRVNIKTRPLSYLEANLKLGSARICFGLMYPYQRGRSLSGRMWQGPILGCIVISEDNTNSFSCPGVFEVSNFTDNIVDLNNSSTDIASISTRFWNRKTDQLATDLKISFKNRNLTLEILYCRLLLLHQHINFFWMFILRYRVNNLKFRVKRRIRRTIQR